MLSLWKKHTRVNTVFALAAAAFLLVNFFGFAHMSMTMDADGHMIMSDCPFMGTSICNMSPFEHVVMWQNLFTTTPHELNQTLALLLLIVSALGIAWIRYLFPPPREPAKQCSYCSYHERAPIINVLQELFSSGILNPKPF